MTIGVVIGAILASTTILFSWWVASILLALAIGLLQSMARTSWKIVRGKAESMKPLD
jgi:hypothetical protein